MIKRFYSYRPACFRPDYFRTDCFRNCSSCGGLVWAWVYLLAICLVETHVAVAVEPNDEFKPRVVVLTDVSTWETDDSESLVRLLAHADLLEIEGLVFTTGWSLDRTRDDFMALIHQATDAYEHDLPNLQRRSNQSQFNQNEARQTIGYWPSPKYLRDRTLFGSRKRGAEHIGANNDSPGSQWIIDLADEADERPLWINVWGGGNTLAQSIWRVQHDRSAEDLQRFLKKLRVYTITDQDREQKTPFSDSSHQWMRREFEKDLFFIWDECAWKYQNGTGRNRWTAYETHIQGHGQLGSVYPKYKYGVEGDTPAFLHLLPIGLNEPGEPTQGGWGGYFRWGQSEDRQTRCFTNFEKPAYDTCRQLAERFYPAAFNNFAARMDWAKEGQGNRNPVVIINGDRSTRILQQPTVPGAKISLDASSSFDPDDHTLAFQWWILKAAGTYGGEVVIEHADQSKIVLTLPADLADKSLHVICEVSDDGQPSLTSYRRVILRSRSQAMNSTKSNSANSNSDNSSSAHSTSASPPRTLTPK